MNRRIVVVGTTGSGKTMLARQIAVRLAIPYVELDALHWGPQWTPVPTEILRQRAAEATGGDRWVVDGNYSNVRDIIWPRAEVIVWLDYGLPLIFWRLARRTIHRLRTREELWQGNRESWGITLLSRNSLFVWALQTYRQYRRVYPLVVAQPEHAHLTLIRLRSPRQTERWLRGPLFPPGERS
jgi:adenylate kinase family enzyme